MVPLLCGGVGHLRPRQRRGARRSAARRPAKPLPAFRAHNEQSHGPCGDRIRQGVTAPARHGLLHQLHRSRRAQHGDLPPPSHPRQIASRCSAPSLPGDVFAGRGPDPVLQQVEDFADGSWWKRQRLLPPGVTLLRPHPAAGAARARRCRGPWRLCSTPPRCGPVTLAFCQDTQTEAWDFLRRDAGARHLVHPASASGAGRAASGR